MHPSPNVSPNRPTASDSVLHNTLQELRHPDVRNLAWLLGSPSMLHAWPDHVLTRHPHANTVALNLSRSWEALLAAYQPRLLELDRDPHPLLNTLATHRSTRLGIYAENLFRFWLEDGAAQRCHPFELLEHNVQLFRHNEQAGQITLGELDYIVRNHDSNETEHWELALKFYLFEYPPTQNTRTGTTEPTQLWQGINRNDSLGRKLHQLLSKPFGENVPARYAHLRKRAIIKGRLFLPSHAPSFDTAHAAIACVEPATVSGTWQQLDHDNPPLHTHWKKLSRKSWLAAHTGLDAHATHSISKIENSYAWLFDKQEAQPLTQNDTHQALPKVSEYTAGMYINTAHPSATDGHLQMIRTEVATQAR